jgi:DNA-binding CsgD family transcriptional regulator/MFS family permease
MGLGVWLAWLLLAYSGTVWLSDVEIDGSNLSTMYLISTATSAVVLLVAPLFKRFFERLLKVSSGVYLGALFAMLGALSVIFAGPYYTGIPALFLTGNVLMGIGSAVLALKCGQLFGELQPQRALIYTLLSQLVIALVFYFVVGNDFIQPVSGGPSLGGILALVFLPLLSAFLVNLKPPASTNIPATEQDVEQTVDQSRTESVSMLPRVFWKFIFAIFVFTLAASVAQGYYTAFRLPSETFANTLYVMTFRSIFALGFILITIRFLKNIAFNKLYLLCMVIMAVAFAIIPLLKIDSAIFSSIVGFIYTVFDFLVWCFLAFIVYEKRLPSTLVFGFGRGVFMAGSAIGWLLGVQVLHAVTGTTWEVAFFVVLAFFILLSTTLVFTEKDFDLLFASAEKRELALEELFPAFATESNKSEDEHERARPWLSACKSLGGEGHLSSREQEILEFLALGRPNESIAKHLSISMNTVRTHTQNIYAKFNVHSRQELIALVEAKRDKELHV